MKHINLYKVYDYYKAHMTNGQHNTLAEYYSANPLGNLVYGRNFTIEYDGYYFSYSITNPLIMKYNSMIVMFDHNKMCSIRKNSAFIYNETDYDRTVNEKVNKMLKDSNGILTEDDLSVINFEFEVGQNVQYD